MEKKTITCKRCGATWTPKVPTPVKCPRCLSHLYYKERKPGDILNQNK